MKKSLLYLTPVILIILATTFPGKKMMTSGEIFDQVIQYYDPNGIWDEFSGSMRMHTIFDDNISIEDITIDNKAGYYHSTRHYQDSTFTIGRENGKSFFKVNGSPIAAKAISPRLQKWPYRLKESAAVEMSEHHTVHFSLPLAYKSAGAKPLPKVGSARLYDKNYSIITLPSLPDAKGWMYKDVEIELYVDTKNGYRVDAVSINNSWGKDKKGGIALFKGELEINGLKIPARKVYLNRADMSYAMMDAFESL
ncbi:MAG: hypothetical protein KTR30_30245 [Saprospiraceae bacterium]|nr:hypothetical protein [Saprospiraceae bacterium]